MSFSTTTIHFRENVPIRLFHTMFTDLDLDGFQGVVPAAWLHLKHCSLFGIRFKDETSNQICIYQTKLAEIYSRLQLALLQVQVCVCVCDAFGGVLPQYLGIL